MKSTTRNVDPQVARQRAQAAAAARWARPGSREAASAAKKQALREHWEREVDPDQVLDPQVRQRLGEQALSAHMARLSVAGAIVRARKQAEAKLAVLTALLAEAEVVAPDDDDGTAA